MNPLIAKIFLGSAMVEALGSLVESISYAARERRESQIVERLAKQRKWHTIRIGDAVFSTESAADARAIVGGFDHEEEETEDEEDDDEDEDA